MDGYTFSLERYRRLIAHESAAAAAADPETKTQLEQSLARDILALYRELEGCGGVTHPAPKRPGQTDTP